MATFDALLPGGVPNGTAVPWPVLVPGWDVLDLDSDLASLVSATAIDDYTVRLLLSRPVPSRVRVSVGLPAIGAAAAEPTNVGSYAITMRSPANGIVPVIRAVLTYSDPASLFELYTEGMTDGQLYTATIVVATSRVRIGSADFTGKSTSPTVKAVTVTKTGFRVTFTKPMSPSAALTNPAKYAIVAQDGGAKILISSVVAQPGAYPTYVDLTTKGGSPSRRYRITVTE